MTTKLLEIVVPPSELAVAIRDAADRIEEEEISLIREPVLQSDGDVCGGLA